MKDCPPNNNQNAGELLPLRFLKLVVLVSTIKETEKMNSQQDTRRPPIKAKGSWSRYILIALILEKIIQHIVVTIALYFNWMGISSTVAPDPAILMVLGAIVAVLFALALWGMITRKSWAINLVIALALFDIIGEFVAQGQITIAITVSFLVAIVLLVLALVYRRQLLGAQ